MVYFMKGDLSDKSSGTCNDPVTIQHKRFHTIHQIGAFLVAADRRLEIGSPVCGSAFWGLSSI